MNRKTSVFAGMLLGLAPLLLGQEVENGLAPRSAEDLLRSQQLVAWSWLQSPRPVPQPLPPPDKSTPQPDPQTQQPARPQTQQPMPSQNFTGKIVKTGEKFILKAGSTSYQLDDQNSAKRYEGKDVRIVGTLDAGGDTIHIAKIELVS
jgi:hypothetical protein